jgi:hypothetical protein
MRPASEALRAATGRALMCWELLGWNAQVFQGEYGDFSEGWYRSVGASIITTMLLNIVIPHITVFRRVIAFNLRKCLDRGCTFNKAVTHQTTQKVGRHPDHTFWRACLPVHYVFAAL